jgi:hypothetical protein
MTRGQKVLVVVLLTYHVLPWPTVAHADGGRLYANGEYGAWQVSVFGSRPLVGSGPTEFNVYVQDAKTGTVATDIEVTIEARHSDAGAVKRVKADTSPVKSLHTGFCELNQDGTWHVTTTITGQQQEPQKIDFDFTVRQLLPPWFSMACWIGWPIIPVALFSIHQRLRRKEGAKVALHPIHSGSRAMVTL